MSALLLASQTSLLYAEHSRRKGKHKPVKGLHSIEPAEKDGREQAAETCTP